MNKEDEVALVLHMQRTTSLFETLIEVIGEIVRTIHDRELSISVAAKLHAFAAVEEIGEMLADDDALEGEKGYLRGDHDHGEAEDGATA